MIRKVIVIVLTVTIVLSMCSCSKGIKSGKPYINKSDDFADGFNYWTEEGQSDNFIAYKARDGRVLLYPLNAEKPLAYDPDGLCDVKPGDIYKIRYDAQHISGGIAGKLQAYFLAVYDFKEADPNKMFENGYLKPVGGWSKNFPLGSGIDGNDFIVFENEDGGYDLYSESKGKRHYDEMREIKFPLEFEDADTVEMEFNVFCNKDLTDEYITGCILNRKTDEGFVFFDADHPGDVTKDTDYDSIKKASVDSLYWYNLMCIKSDTPVTEESRRLITYEDMTEKTADELGLDQAVYDQLYSGWKDMLNGKFTYQDYHTEPAKKCDILLFGGDFGANVDMKYDKDLKIQPYDWYEYDKIPNPRYQYVALFIRCEFNDLLPQD